MAPEEEKTTPKEDRIQEDRPRKRRNPFNTQQLKEERERRQKKRARLIVRNVSYKATEDSLRQHFQQWGELEDVNLLKRPDGKLVGCAFVQYATVNQATKAILQGNNKEFLGRVVYVDWALGKDEYTAKNMKQEPKEKKPKLEDAEELQVKLKLESEDEDEDEKTKGESDSEEDDEEAEDNDSDGSSASDEDDDDDGEDDDEGEDADDKSDLKSKKLIPEVKKEKHVSNDVQEGCTVFIKNVPFDAEDIDLRKVCRIYGPLFYAIINRDRVSGHSKGTAFVKFKRKESADMCLQAGTEFLLNNEVLDPHPALSREEIKKESEKKSKEEEDKDSRNLYLAREGIIMSGSKAAEGVSSSDMNKRHKLEQTKTEVLKNLNRFVSRNRLSMHNLPLNYDNEKLKQMIITYTGFRPHECRVMRENKITPEHPKGKSKGFGFMSFNTHKEALIALRKLNNNPQIFGTNSRPIVAFSIEDRAVHKIKENRKQKSKLNNPTYQSTLEKRKEARKQKRAQAASKFNGPTSDDKQKLQKHIKKLEAQRAAQAACGELQKAPEVHEQYVGTAANPGAKIRMRSNKKIREQSQEHQKRVKADKRKEKNRKQRQTHLAERKSIDRPKQGRKIERDDLSHLVNKYKRMIDTKANGEGASKAKKPKRTKWYAE